jgi:hypothetical protein
MALPPYFTKVALGATALMQGAAAEEFRHRVDTLSVTIAFGPDAAESREGRCILDLVTNLLARFYPTLRFWSYGSGPALVSHLQASARAINPNIEFTEQATPACIVVGQTTAPDAQFKVFLGSEGWTAHVSTDAPRVIGESDNPFGAGAAACIGAAFVFRHFFHEDLGVPTPAETFWLSLASYEVGLGDKVQGSRDGDPEVHIDFGEVALVGVGAIGNGAVWAVGAAPCSGVLHLVDPETVDDTNPQRYVLTDAGSREPKVELAAKYLHTATVRPEPHNQSWAEFASAREFALPPIVAVGLDTAFDRCAVQASLPEFLLNAWTQRGDLGVSRHEFLGDSACLACLYWPRSVRKNLDEMVMEAIRYSGPLMEVRNALYLQTQLDDGWLDRISTDMGVPRAAVEAFRNRTLDQFYREAICGGHVIAGKQGSVEVPMAFQSAMAGIMLAGEIIKTAREPRLQGDIVTTKIDLLRPIGTKLSERTRKASSTKCICGDHAYLQRYKEKYPHRVQDMHRERC